jgi:response regulator RpfG family c-di-GMP phosphodiesterase
MEKANILLVDDRPENLITLEAILEDLGQNLIKANSGQEALRLVLNQDFAVILLDVQMPDMDGYETAALIRKRKKSQNIPIIFLTAIYESKECVSKGYSIGAVDYLYKPYDPEILRSKVMVFVELYQYREQAKQHALLVQSEALLRKHTEELEQINKKLEIEIVERKSAEKKLKEYTRKLEESNRNLEDFAHIASHDLQEPLRKVLAFSDRLSEKYQGLLDETGQDYLRRMQDATRRMQTLINDLLAYSRVSSQAHPFEDVDLSKVASNVISDLEPRIEICKGIIESGELPTIQADDSQMYQLFQNLIAEIPCSRSNTTY